MRTSLRHMSPVTRINQRPQLGQTTMEIKFQFITDVLERIDLTMRSAPWGVKFPFIPDDDGGGTTTT